QEIGRADRALAAGHHAEHPDLIGSRPARQPGAAHDGNWRAARAQPDPAAEERDDLVARAAGWSRGGRDAEDARVLQEQLALLREEQIEAREVDLLLIGLDLREVRPVAEVERHRLGLPVLAVEPAIDVFSARRQSRVDRLRDRKGVDLEVASLANVVQ